MNKNHIVIGVLAVALAIAGLYIAGIEFDRAATTSYNEGFQDGYQQSSLQNMDFIISSLNNQGFVPVTLPTQDNQTVMLRLGIIPDNAD